MEGGRGDNGLKRRKQPAAPPSPPPGEGGGGESWSGSVLTNPPGSKQLQESVSAQETRLCSSSRRSELKLLHH